MSDIAWYIDLAAIIVRRVLKSTVKNPESKSKMRDVFLEAHRDLSGLDRMIVAAYKDDPEFQEE